MKTSKILSCLILFFTTGLLFVFSACEQEDDKISISDRQLHLFSESDAGFYNNSPTLVDSFIYIGTSRGKLYNIASDNAFYKLDKNLNKVWSYSLDSNEVIGSSALDKMGNIYFVVGENRTSYSYFTKFKLYSLSSDGSLKWTKTIWERTIEFSWIGINSPAISVDDIIYVGGDNFYAFDPDGNEKWKYPLNQNQNPFLNSPIIDTSGNIYFIHYADLISLDKNGVERWRACDWANPFSSPAFSVDYDKIFYTTRFNGIYCVNSSDGSLIWEYAIPDITGDIRATPAVDDNNNIYIGSHGEDNEDTGQTLYAIKSDGSGLLWKNNLGSDLYSSPALGNDRILYIGSEGYGKTSSNFNRLHAISMLSGEIVWSAQLEMDITWSSAAISNDGTLYIASMDNYAEGRKGMIYSFKTTSTGLLSNTGSPRYHEGNKSTGRRE